MSTPEKAATEDLKKLAARPNSKWATGNRLPMKGFSQPKGFARGARVK